MTNTRWRYCLFVKLSSLSPIKIFQVYSKNQSICISYSFNKNQTDYVFSYFSLPFFTNEQKIVGKCLSIKYATFLLLILFILDCLRRLQTRGSQPFSSAYPLCTLGTFRVPPGYNFSDPRTPNIITCIPLCFNLQTLELFAYPLELFSYPLGLKYPRLRTPALDEARGHKSRVGESGSRLESCPFIFMRDQLETIGLTQA